MVLGIWFGMTTGFGELILLAIKKYALHRFILVGANTVWMTPLADMFLFAIPASILALLAWRNVRCITLRSAILVYSFLAVLSLVLMYALLHWAAAVFLSLGLAVQISWIAGKFRKPFLSLVFTTSPWLVALIVLIAFGMMVMRL